MPTSYEVIVLSQLSDQIEELLTEFNRFLKKQHKKQKNTLKEMLTRIDYYFAHPELVHKASYIGGLEQLKKSFDAKLFRVRLYLNDGALLNEAEAETACLGFTRLAEKIKIKRAYTEIRKGKKFNKAGITAFNDKKPISQTNPIKRRSQKNINKLVTFLNDRSDVTNTYFGLREDEYSLFKYLCNLPYQLQHATNHFYAIQNAGVLKSYKEIKRDDPDYHSSFSTDGNVKKLGNDGFVFFRVFTPYNNNTQTRYGDTRIMLDFNILREHGWVSLHDQLNSFPSTNVNTRRFYSGYNLIRTSEAVALENDTKDKALNDGLHYRYRVEKLTAKKKDTIKSFGDQIETQERTDSFLTEIFYAKDIIPGIALSFIRELWFLEDSGFRKKFLKQFKNADQKEKYELLSQLMKDFFRIEAKYPVKMCLTPDFEKKTVLFKPFFEESPSLTRKVIVDNPDGNGYLHVDMSENALAKEIYEAEKRKKELQQKISNAQRGRARALNSGNKKAHKTYDKEVTNLKKEKTENETYLDEIQEAREDVIDYFTERDANITQDEFEKVDYSKLKFIKRKFNKLIRDELVDLSELLELPHLQLIILSSDNFIQLVKSTTKVSFADLANCSLPKVELIAELFKHEYFYKLFLNEVIPFDKLSSCDLAELNILLDGLVNHHLDEIFDDDEIRISDMLKHLQFSARAAKRKKR